MLMAQSSRITSTTLPAPVSGFLSDEETVSTCTVAKKSASPNPWMSLPLRALSHCQPSSAPTQSTTTCRLSSMISRATSRLCRSSQVKRRRSSSRTTRAILGTVRADAHLAAPCSGWMSWPAVFVAVGRLVARPARTSVTELHRSRSTAGTTDATSPVLAALGFDRSLRACVRRPRAPQGGSTADPLRRPAALVRVAPDRPGQAPEADIRAARPRVGADHARPLRPPDGPVLRRRQRSAGGGAVRRPNRSSHARSRGRTRHRLTWPGRSTSWGSMATRLAEALRYLAGGEEQPFDVCRAQPERRCDLLERHAVPLAKADRSAHLGRELIEPLCSPREPLEIGIQGPSKGKRNVPVLGSNFQSTLDALRHLEDMRGVPPGELEECLLEGRRGLRP